MSYKESEATVLFMDIVNFTSKAESMSPIEVSQFLNNIFTEMTDIIFKYNGTLDKYIGDAIMAVFGVPFKYDNHAEFSILAALDMQKKMEEINSNLPRKSKTRIRIGINSGKLISGDFGSPKRFDYTVLGNTVNIASRLESTAAKPDEIIISENTYNLTKNSFEFEYLGKKKMQGISNDIKSYKVIKKMGGK
jgi:adenylate cyclase